MVGCTQSYVESKVEGLEDQLRKMKTQVDDLTRTNSELVNTRNRLTTENSDLQRQIRELETNYGSFSKNRGQLQSQLDDAKSKLEEEIRVFIAVHCSILCFMLSTGVPPNDLSVLASFHFCRKFLFPFLPVYTKCCIPFTVSTRGLY